MPQGLQDILHHPAVWRLGQLPVAKHRGIPSGYAALDRELPENGWPVGALTELLTGDRGIGELSLLVPALRTLSAENRAIALLAPPQLPHAQAWQAAGIALERLLIVAAQGSELLWAAEQILRSGECAAVLLWMQQPSTPYKALQRLHRAADCGKSACLLYRPTAAQSSPSPAPLRLALRGRADALEISIVKRRGALAGKPFTLQPFPPHWHAPDNVAPDTAMLTRPAAAYTMNKAP